MRTDSYDAGTITAAPPAGVEAESPATSAQVFPFLALTPLARDILANAERLPDGDLMRVAGTLRSLADEVLAVVDRRLGQRPAPRLVVDNTRR